MINVIGSWAEQVIIAVIIGTIIEMILPKGNTEKYIKTVIGIYILYTIISPAIGFLTGKEFKLTSSDYEKYFNYTNEQKEIDDISSNTTQDIYEKELEKKIKSDIEGMGFILSYITLDLNIENGVIQNVELSVEKKEKETNDNVIVINNVEIEPTEEKSKENSLTRQEIERIKEKLNQDYGIDKEEIKINSI